MPDFRPISSTLLLWGLLPSLSHAQLQWTVVSQSKSPAITEEKGAYEFKAKNIGTEPIRVIGLLPTCGCLSAKSSLEVVPPGGNLTIAAVMEYGQMQGEQRKSIIVTSQASGAPEATRETLETIVQLAPIYEVTGKVAKFAVKGPLTPHTAVVKIVGPEPISLSLGATSSDAVTAALTEIKPGREYHVTLTPVNLLKKGMGSVTLLGKSPAPRAKQLDLFFTITPARR